MTVENRSGRSWRARWLPPSLRDLPRWIRRAGVLVLVVLIALASWGVLVPVAGIDLRARTGETVSTVGPVSVATAAMLAAGAGWVLLAVLERLVQRPLRVWIVAATAVLVVSLLGPLAGTTASAVVGLMVLHVVVGLAVIVGDVQSA